MDQLKPIETKLAELFNGAPDMSASAKKTLAGVLEWIALIFGVLQLLAVWGLWSTGHRVNEFIDVANSYSAAVGGPSIAPKLGITYYLALIVLLFSAVSLLMAYPGLKARKKIGWDWLFLGSLVNLVYGVVAVFVGSRIGGGLSDLIWSLIGSAIGFYLLFQVRELFSGKEHSKSEHTDTK